MEQNLKNRIYLTGFFLLLILAIGTFGYAYITNYEYDIFSCFYMTVLTVTTIGFDEIIPLEYYTGGRPFTVFLAFAGIGVLTYFVSTITAVIVGGQLKESYKTRKMEKIIEKFEDHYIICGAGSHSLHILDELNLTKRKNVLVELNQATVNDILIKYPKQKYIIGDASQEDILAKACVSSAKGLFAATNDDNINLVICLIARRINPGIRIISVCSIHSNETKIKLAGADIVVSSSYMGGMRMASEMLRPSVTHMLDLMLSDAYKTLRLEQINISDDLVGKPIKELKLENFKESLLIAVQSGSEIKFKPDDDYVIIKGDVMLILTTPDERIELTKIK